VLEVAGEVGPAIDLEEQVGQVDPGEVLGDLRLQRGAPLGRLLGRERGEHQPTLLDSHRIVLRPVPVEPSQFLLQLGPAFLQSGRPVLGELEQSAKVLAIPGPLLAWDQVCLGVGEPTAGLQPDVAGPQRGPEFPERAQLVVMAIDLAVPADDVGSPPSRDELDGGVRGQLPLRPCRRPREAAVEQVDDLVGGLLQGLAEKRDQDGVPPLGGGPLQGLVGRPLAESGQELEPGKWSVRVCARRP
jgi:hypothetical protein